jgi:hypothetical protein
MNWTPGISPSLVVVRRRSLTFSESSHGLSNRLDSGLAGIGFIGRKALTI